MLKGQTRLFYLIKLPISLLQDTFLLTGDFFVRTTASPLFRLNYIYVRSSLGICIDFFSSQLDTQICGHLAWFGWFFLWRASVSPFLSWILVFSCLKSQLYSFDIDGFVLNLSICRICGFHFWEKMSQKTSSQQ